MLICCKVLESRLKVPCILYLVTNSCMYHLNEVIYRRKYFNKSYILVNYGQRINCLPLGNKCRNSPKLCNASSQRYSFIKLTHCDETKKMAHDTRIVRGKENLNLRHGGSSQRQARSTNQRIKALPQGRHFSLRPDTSPFKCPC